VKDQKALGCSRHPKTSLKIPSLFCLIFVLSTEIILKKRKHMLKPRHKLASIHPLNQGKAALIAVESFSPHEFQLVTKSKKLTGSSLQLEISRRLY